MSVRKTREIRSGLTSKGFVQSECDHSHLILYIDGKKTKIRTKVSHGSKSRDCGDYLLSIIKKQLRLHTKKQLLDLIDCPMTEHDYINILRANGIIS